MKVLFFGSREAGLETLKRLVASRHEVCCVTTRDYGLDRARLEDFDRICGENSIPLFETDKIENEEWAKRYRQFDADLGVCVEWRRIIGPKIMDTTRYGFIGPHYSDLPRYRGFASTHYAMLNGDPHCGVCIMKFKPGTVDDGDICRRFWIPLDEQITIKDLFDRARPLIARHILKTIDAIEKGTLMLEPQDESSVVLSFPRIPEDGEIDWNRSAEEISRLVRTVTRPYPGAFTYFRNRKMCIWRAHALQNPPRFVGVPGHVVHFDGKIGVLTGSGILILDECQLDGDDDSFDLRKVFRSYRLRLGMNHSREIYRMTQRIDRLERELAEMKEKRKSSSLVR